MNLLPRPLRVSRVFWAKRLAAAVGLVLLATFFVTIGVAAFREGNWEGLAFAAVGVVPLGAIVWVVRSVRAVQQLAQDGEEVLGVLAQQQDIAGRTEAGIELRVRRYHFVVDGVMVDHGASQRVDRPLFLDHAHSRALFLRSRSQPSLIRVVRNDLQPFAFTPDEERALRERVEQMRDLKKLVSDIHTC